MHYTNNLGIYIYVHPIFKKKKIFTIFIKIQKFNKNSTHLTIPKNLTEIMTMFTWY